MAQKAFKDRVSTTISSLTGYSPKAQRPSFVSYVLPFVQGGSGDKRNSLRSPASHTSDGELIASGHEQQQHFVDCEPDEVWETHGDDDDTIMSLSRSPSYDAIDNVYNGHTIRLNILTANNSYRIGDSPSKSQSNRDSVVTRDGHFIALRESEKIMSVPVESTIRYCLDRKRTRGTIGRLILTNMRINFENYHDASDSPQDCSPSQVNQLPPFDVHSFLEEDGLSAYDSDIDLINVYSCKVESPAQVTSHLLLTVYCNDFRCVEFLLTNNATSKALLDEIEKLVSGPPTQSNLLLSPYSKSQPPVSPSRIFVLPMLWYQITTDNPFFHPVDWQVRENSWFSINNAIRITQCNENLQLSSNRPYNFVTLGSGDLSDMTLMHSISTQMRGQRVPIITFAVPKATISNKASLSYHTTNGKEAFHLLLRSAAVTEDVANLMRLAVSPLRIVDLNAMLPNLASVELAYSKMHEACHLYTDTTHYIISTGKWTKIVLKVFRTARDLAKILSKESSLLITEDNDQSWNPVVSSLIQVILDPDRRTVRGFESLISKEFMFLTGFANKYPDAMKTPNHFIFTIFIDAVFQILSYGHNWRHFEFTSLYLIRLFDLSYVPSSFSSVITPGHQMGQSSKSYEDLTGVGSAAAEEAANRRKSYMPNGQTTQANSQAAANHGQKRSEARERTSGLGYEDISMTLQGLDCDQLVLLINPFYERKSKRLKCPQLLMQVTFFEPLYLRWHRLHDKSHYYNKFPGIQFYYFNSVIGNLSKETKPPVITETEL